MPVPVRIGNSSIFNFSRIDSNPIPTRSGDSCNDEKMKSNQSSLSHFDLFFGALLHPLDFSRSISLSSSPNEDDQRLYLFSGRGFLLPLFFSMRSSSPFATASVYSHTLSRSSRMRDCSLIFPKRSFPPYSSSIFLRAER